MLTSPSLKWATSTVVIMLVGIGIAGCARAEAESGTRSIQSEADFDLMMSSCMAERGWVMIVDPNGGLTMDLPPDAQLPIYYEDRDTCLGTLGQLEARELTEVEMNSLYEAQLAVLECLVVEGFAIEEAPSYQEYAQSFLTDQWSPYSKVSPADFAAAESLCPQTPPVY
jgi:hypothetical protein